MSERIGFQKVAFVGPRLTGAALGALTGAAVAPEEEGWTGAALGGLAGYGTGAALSHGMNFAKGLRAPKGPAAPPATPPSSGSPAVPPGYSPQEMAAAHHEIDTFLKRPPTDPVFDAKLQAAQQQRAQQVSEAQKALDRLRAAKGKSDRTWNAAAKAALPHTSPRMQEAVLSNPRVPINETAQGLKRIRANEARAARATPRMMPKVGFAKVAEVGFSAGLPGFSVSRSAKDERLEGMNRWVPRSTIEQAYQGLESGLDETALLTEAANRGHLAHPLIGAALASALAHKALPESSRGLKTVAGLVGGGLGSLANQAGQPGRVENMRQAIRGVQNEMRRQTAGEATPLVVSSTAGET